jgi:hypothetical protein
LFNSCPGHLTVPVVHSPSAPERPRYNAALSVNHRRNRFRDALAQLTHDFAEGLVEAVRSASLEEFLALLDEQARRPAAPSYGPRAAPPRRTAAPRQRRAVGVIERSDAEAEEPGDSSAITDPARMLEALEGAAEPLPITAAIIPKEVSATETPPMEKADSPPTLRTGEEVLRTSTGGLVLRRRRGRPSPAPAA